jgi:nucleoid DNA-binding protein
MNSMTKRDLVVRISDETSMVQQQVQDIVQRTLDIIAESLAKGAKVELRNFGVFDVKVRKARIGRNPNAPTNDVRIPPRAIVKFKPGKEMREAVAKLSPNEGAPASAGTPASGVAPQPTPPAQ